MKGAGDKGTDGGSPGLPAQHTPSLGNSGIPHGPNDLLLSTPYCARPCVLDPHYNDRGPQRVKVPMHGGGAQVGLSLEQHLAEGIPRPIIDPVS